MGVFGRICRSREISAGVAAAGRSWSLEFARQDHVPWSHHVVLPQSSQSSSESAEPSPLPSLIHERSRSCQPSPRDKSQKFHRKSLIFSPSPGPRKSPKTRMSPRGNPRPCECSGQNQGSGRRCAPNGTFLLLTCCRISSAIGEIDGSRTH